MTSGFVIKGDHFTTVSCNLVKLLHEIVLVSYHDDAESVQFLHVYRNADAAVVGNR